ncbi:MAG: hypothetical protein FJ386_09490 [Verrucomicrobia bacterium]|nr:hypothetical protein [Verrucomicrobiota bacterium]
MNEREIQDLMDAARRRPLNAGDEARLRAHFLLHPGAQAAWEEHLALSRMLGRLPDAPLSRHFTERVLERVAPEQRSGAPIFNWEACLAWLRGTQWARAGSMAALAAAVIVMSQRHYDQSSRFELAAALQAVSSVAKLPSVDMLKDFDVINSLGSLTPSADVDLLNALDRDPN